MRGGSVQYFTVLASMYVKMETATLRCRTIIMSYCVPVVLFVQYEKSNRATHICHDKARPFHHHIRLDPSHPTVIISVMSYELFIYITVVYLGYVKSFTHHVFTDTVLARLNRNRHTNTFHRPVFSSRFHTPLYNTPHLETSNDEYHSASSTLEWVDRAPCLDGLCASEPIDFTSSTNITTTTTTHSFITPPKSSTDDPLITTSSTRIGLAMERLGADKKMGPTVWSEFGRLAQAYNIQANLGQGFPNWTPPQFAIDSLVEAAIDCSTHMSPHQYTRTAGHVNLVVQLARRYSIHLKRQVDAMNEVAVTVGASQALYLALQTLLRPGK